MLSLAEQAWLLEAETPQPLYVDVTATESVLTEHGAFTLAWLTWLEEAAPTLWMAFQEAIARHYPNCWLLQSEQRQKSISFSTILVDNNSIQALNSQYRGKNEPTDVITFSLLSDGWHADSNQPDKPVPGLSGYGDRHPLLQLPEIDLGEVYLCVPWVFIHGNPLPHHQSQAEAHCWFLAERWVHGMLHLLGLHHDTLSDYNTVVAIQTQVLTHGFTHHPVVQAV